jgi:hypothetical protein
MPENRAPVRPSRFGPLGCLLAMAALLILTPVLGIWIYVMLASGRAAKALDAVRAEGEPISADELEAYYSLSAGAEDPTPLWLAAIAPLESPGYTASAGDLPIVGTGEGKVPLPGEPWEQHEAARKHLADYSTYLEKMHEAARIGGPARYPTDFHDGLGMLLPHAQKLRQAVRLLDLEARVKARDGDAVGAAESLHAMLAAAESLEREPILISQLVRIACATVAAGTLEDLLPHTEFSEEDLARLQADLAAADHQAGLQRALMGERGFGVMAFQNPQMLSDEVGGIAGKAVSLTRRDDLVFYLECMNRYIAAAKKPWPQARQDAAAATQAFDDEFGQSVASRARYMLTGLMLPAMDAAIEGFARGQARSNVAATALAVERYRLKHDRLPEKLSQLVPEFLPAVPADPYDGRPLRYVIHEDGYTVYSVGGDGMDDGGVETEQTAEPDLTFTATRPNRE